MEGKTIYFKTNLSFCLLFEKVGIFISISENYKIWFWIFYDEVSDKISNYYIIASILLLFL